MDYTRTGKLTLDALPDDCLECIFNKVDSLETQIQISKVCAVFQDVIVRMWRRNEAFKCVCIELLFNLCGTDHIAYFLQNMHSTIREIIIHDNMLTTFHHDVIKNTQIACFPNVLTLEIIGNTNYDLEILLLAKLFPNVKILKLNMATLAYLIGFQKLFQQLEELHFPSLIAYEDNDKLIQVLPQIFDNLTQLKVLDIRQLKSKFLDISSIEKCRQLKVLKLNSENLSPVLNKAMKLSSLKKLNVGVRNDYKTEAIRDFYYILANKSGRITGIAIDNESMRLEPHWDENLKIVECNKLRKFAFIHCMRDILEEAVRIEELSFLCLPHYSQVTIEKLLKILVSSSKLEHLDITYCYKLHDLVNFLNGAMHVLKSQKKRKSLLTVYYGGVSDDDIVNSTTDLKKLSNYPHYNINRLQYYIEL